MNKLPLVFLFLLYTINLFAAHKITENGYALILLGDDTLATETGWTNHADTQRLTNYAQSRNMKLIDDMRPVANQKASFIAAPGVTFTITGFKPQKTYHMWVDFVRFTFDKNPGIFSKLMVFVDGRQVDEITWGTLEKEKLYSIELPLDLTYDGSVNVTFKEKAMNYGYWGVWDIIIASGDLPEGSYFDEDVREMTTVDDVQTEPAERETRPERTQPGQAQTEPQPAEPARQPAPQQRERTQPRTRRQPAPERRTPPARRTPQRAPEPEIPEVDEPVDPLVDDVTVDSPEMPDPPTTR
ncbi:MAG: hypothetical protein ACOC2H_07565 [Spirochaetota bacterium]